jgi:uncharacterized protein (TIGR00730 family)
MTSPDEPSSPRVSNIAYEDPFFINSVEGRPLRILAEYLGPLERMRQENIHDTIVFFGSARLKEDGPLAAYYEAARSLAEGLTVWAKTLEGPRRFVICTGGGGGIMEAANRGAADGGGPSIGLNICLPYEQKSNAYVSPELAFEFHYFFMRKLWFTQLARGLVVFPGGFGTLDELMEMLTLSQTKKLDRKITIILYGTAFWRELINFDLLIKHGMILESDLELFHFVDDVASALDLLKRNLPKNPNSHNPSLARSRTVK